MTATTSLLATLFGHHQPYGDALLIPCGVVLELIESKLDESLSYLEGDHPRLARTELMAESEYGSVGNYRDELLRLMRATPSPVVLDMRKWVAGRVRDILGR